MWKGNVREQLTVTAAEMNYLKAASGIMRLDKLKNEEIYEILDDTEGKECELWSARVGHLDTSTPKEGQTVVRSVLLGEKSLYSTAKNKMNQSSWEKHWSGRFGI